MNDLAMIQNNYQELVNAWRGLLASDKRQIEVLLDGFEAKFAFNSGRIENQAITYHDTRDVFQYGQVKGFKGDPRTLFEIQNLKTCQDFLQSALERHEPLDEKLVLETHRFLTQGTYGEKRWAAGERPGSYKRGDYVVGLDDAGLPAEEVPAAIMDLLQELEVCNESNVLTVTAYFHVVFESIHPFADGNGRVGRALLNYLLQSKNHPPLIVFNEDKLSYYGAMEAWDKEGDLEPMKLFLQIETVKTWRDRL